MPLTVHGMSTTIERDSFQYEEYAPVGSLGTKIQWDYRDASGVLHTGIACDLDRARTAAREYGFSG